MNLHIKMIGCLHACVNTIPTTGTPYGTLMMQTSSLCTSTSSSRHFFSTHAIFVESTGSWNTKVSFAISFQGSDNTKAWQIWTLHSFLWPMGGVHHARIRIGCSKLKSHLYHNLHVIEEESCHICVIGSRIHSISLSNALVMLPCQTIFSQVLHNMPMIVYKCYCLFGDPKPTHKQTAIYLMPCRSLLPYQNTLTDPFMRCPLALYPSTFDCPSPPSTATQQTSRTHDKRYLYNTCIDSQFSWNKYCLNQYNTWKRILVSNSDVV